MQRGDDGFGVFLVSTSPDVGGTASDIQFDLVEFGKSLKHMRCDGRSVFNVDVVELASGVRPATRLQHTARFTWHLGSTCAQYDGTFPTNLSPRP